MDCDKGMYNLFCFTPELFLGLYLAGIILMRVERSGDGWILNLTEALALPVVLVKTNLYFVLGAAIFLTVIEIWQRKAMWLPTFDSFGSGMSDVNDRQTANEFNHRTDQARQAAMEYQAEHTAETWHAPDANKRERG